ncbi:hypothetical protein UABAM_02107 [Candidatus Uabimicrobium amorphum]|uniref:Uncharacterized protein n=1 Tax=Uabimicrobium amorphum TaxID=2596890 RepID=A0A5S9IKW3_UABAM|nr:hypothetical protein UABAM_02107 [Candidatus Uabimicrobium amorphum]
MIQRKNIFLIDGLGALLSAALLGIVLPLFHVGIPTTTLYLLALIAFVFSLYSLRCHFVKSQRNLWLKLIMTANLLYCALTLFLVVYHWSTMTYIGAIYFLGEISIIVILVWIESRVL